MAPHGNKVHGGTRKMPPRNRNHDAQARRAAFKSSRLEDPEAVHAAEERASINSVESESNVSSSSDDADSRPNYYKLLVQELQSSETRSKPPKKRRKLATLEDQPMPVEDAATSSAPTPADKQSKNDGADQMEAEDAGDLVVSEVIQDNPDEENSPDDPFEVHFTSIPNESLASRIAEIRAKKLSTRRAPFSVDRGATIIQPVSGALGHNTSLGPSKGSASDLSFIKKRIQRRAKATFENAAVAVGRLSGVLLAYGDVLYCARSNENAGHLRSQICVHALNHVLKTRDRVIKNNAKLAKADADVQLEFRDQGFTRPKVLFLLPTRQSCARYVETLMDLFQPEQQENKSRFVESFSQAEDVLSSEKPRDFQDLFSGNDDDMFRLGFKLTRKTVKFFSHFYNSDFIFASPLGLKLALGSADDKDFDRDFLSSIELVLVDHADALLMQNWEHVTDIFENLNAQPRDAHGCDFSRVREWYLDGNARYLRQTVVLTSFNTPEINQIFNQHMLNVAGKTKIARQSCDGVIADLGVQVKQTFSRFDAATPAAEPDARFKYFTSTALTAVVKHARSSAGKPAGILLFIPSYMDFVRVRNFLANSVVAQNISFGAISEYTSVSETARARSHFFFGRHAVLLYTGRAHHFRRYKIRGVRKVLMYALPDNPLFYQEIAGGFLAQSASEGLIEPIDATVQSIFSKWDVIKLERIVGTDRLAAMVKGKGSTFDFV